MKNKKACYIKIDTQNHSIETSGISWNEFYFGIKEKPKGILLIKGSSAEANYCEELSFEYIPSEQMLDFAQSNVWDFGDFQWIDFDEEDRLSDVSDSELAEILFMCHMGKPLKSYKIDSLQNRYVYISHDDAWFVKLYMECLENYKQVINYKICNELKGRKHNIHPIQEDIMAQLFPIFQNGAILDFEQATISKVCIYQLGEVNTLDKIHSLLEQCRKRKEDASLEYNRNIKQWSIAFSK